MPVVQVGGGQHHVQPLRSAAASRRRNGRTATARRDGDRLRLLGNDVEREDQVPRVVDPADRVVDVDVQRAGVGVVEADQHVVHVDPRLPLLQRVPDVVGDRSGGGRVDRREHMVVHPAAELGPHRPLPWRGRQDQPDRLLDLPLPDHQGDPAGRVGGQRERPPGADEVTPPCQPPIIRWGAEMIGAPQADMSPIRRGSRRSAPWARRHDRRRRVHAGGGTSRCAACRRWPPASAISTVGTPAADHPGWPVGSPTRGWWHLRPSTSSASVDLDQAALDGQHAAGLDLVRRCPRAWRWCP